MRTAYIIAIITITCFGCGHKKLDRDTALQLLQNSNIGQKSESIPVPINDCVLLPGDDVSDLMGLKEMGVANVENAGYTKYGQWDAIIWRIQYNEKGQKLLIGGVQKTDNFTRKDGFQTHAKIFDYTLNVTGVTEESDTRASVDYTLTPANFTPFYDWCTKYRTSLCPGLNRQQTNRATFVLYDDGWRLEH